MRLNQSLTAYSRLALFRPQRINRTTIPYYQKRFNPQNAGQISSGLLDQNTNSGAEEEKKGGGNNGGSDSEPNLRSTLLRMFETAATTFASIAILGCVDG